LIPWRLPPGRLLLGRLLLGGLLLGRQLQMYDYVWPGWFFLSFS